MIFEKEGQYHKVSKIRFSGNAHAWCGGTTYAPNTQFLMVELMEPEGGGCKTCYKLGVEEVFAEG